ncbi:MAG: TetR/AcrR family transcriptional regulator [Deltaproteobacteria bacterium]|jgi:AcrR family transcriptional regulator|nr:TetR/AcrR family transcriptional regulator [Deltaproteobacteria bacterium]
MQHGKTRSYKSGIRQRQAQETKNRIASVAETLMKSLGYEKTSISAIAEGAGVSTQTVYSIFGSKQGLLIHIMLSNLDSDYSKYKMEMSADISAENLAERFAQLACYRNRHQHMAMSAFGGFGLIYPELELLISEHFRLRRSMFEEYLSRMKEKDSAGLFASITEHKRKLELIVALTEGGLYHNLVGRAGWSPILFEKVLAGLLDEVVKIPDLD